uniref:Uncharacterized protein n=1 Tax=Molossus molossus TaxID=27622 RepID=A0A7J8IZN6_MOLMO|nr:hypothetical protein HJG59_010250 [Molossus molossus]
MFATFTIMRGLVERNRFDLGEVRVRYVFPASVCPLWTVLCVLTPRHGLRASASEAQVVNRGNGQRHTGQDRQRVSTTFSAKTYLKISIQNVHCVELIDKSRKYRSGMLESGGGGCFLIHLECPKQNTNLADAQTKEGDVGV